LLFFCSFQKSDEKSDRSFALSKRATKSAIALSKRATKRAIALSLFQKEGKRENERSLIFKMSECPTLLAKSLYIKSE